MHNEEKFETKDIWVAAFLKAKGIQMIDIRWSDQTAYFKYGKGAKTAMIEFQNGGSLPAITMKSAIQDLKSIVFDTKISK